MKKRIDRTIIFFIVSCFCYREMCIWISPKERKAKRKKCPLFQSPFLGLFNERQSWMAVRWFFRQTDERRIKARSLGSAAPLQKEEGLNSFGQAMILINNSIPHSHTERAEDRQTGGGGSCSVWSRLPVLENCRKIGSSLITHPSCAIFLQPPAFTDVPFFDLIFFWIPNITYTDRALGRSPQSCTSAWTHPALLSTEQHAVCPVVR